MKILILDPYKNTNYRISKDTSGGYGTGNDFGDTIVPRLLKRLLKKAHDWPPMHAAYTFAVLEQKGHDVKFSKTLPKNLNEFDLFIVASSIVCCETELSIIKKIKSYKKKVFAIGPFATNKPNIYCEAGASVISGEPEFYFLKNNNFENDLNKNIVKFTHDYSLDNLPFPAWDKIIKNDKNVSKLFGNYSTVPILATRGCPYSCFKYCVYPLQQGRKVRQRSAKLIVDEMEYWKNKNIKMFIFRDPVFSINKKHTIEFCNELINRNLNIKFVIETHLRILDAELIKLLKKSGLKAVKVGVESSDEEVLKNASRFTIKKDEQLEKIREIEKNNIQVSAMFILGFPADDQISMDKTISYAKKLNTTYAQFSVWTPYPGTPVYEEYKEKILAKNFEDYDQYNLIYEHKILNKKIIRKFLSKAYDKYYFRPSYFIKSFKSFLYSK